MPTSSIAGIGIAASDRATGDAASGRGALTTSIYLLRPGSEILTDPDTTVDPGTRDSVVSTAIRDGFAC
jgi:hypothetical protein